MFASSESNGESHDTIIKDRVGNELNSIQHSAEISSQDNQPIISELLCFISNKINILPYDVLVKLCVQSFDEVTTKVAKDILYDTAFNNRTAQRKVKCPCGSNKKSADMKNILNIFLDFPSNHVPMYVAKDLSNLPPLSVNNFDIAKIIKDIEQLKVNVAILQEVQGTLLESHVYHTSQLVRMSENMDKLGYSQTSNSTQKPSNIGDSNTSLLLAQSSGVAEVKKSNSHPEETPLAVVL